MIIRKKITLICYYANTVNHLWQEAENRQGDRVTIEPQTFCYLKEIELKITKVQRDTQQWVTITRSRFTDKNKLLPNNKINMLSHSQDKLLMLRR